MSNNKIKSDRLNIRKKIYRNLWLISPKDIGKNVELSWDFKNKILYGPAISRRFGLSLGINLFPYSKNCNFNCIYCLAGSFVKDMKIIPGKKIINILKKDLNQLLIKKKMLNIIDSIGFCGNGEPTLHPDFVQITEFLLNYRDILNKKYDRKLLLGTFSNGSKIDELKSILSKLDILIFKFDVGNQKSFSAINRTKLKLQKVIKSYRNFPKSFIVSAAVVDGPSRFSNIGSLKNEFSNIINTFKKARALQLHNINLPTPIPGIRHVSSEDLLSIGKTISHKLRIPVEILVDNPYVR